MNSGDRLGSSEADAQFGHVELGVEGAEKAVAQKPLIRSVYTFQREKQKRKSWQIKLCVVLRHLITNKSADAIAQ